MRPEKELAESAKDTSRRPRRVGFQPAQIIHHHYNAFPKLSRRVHAGKRRVDAAAKLMNITKQQ